MLDDRRYLDVESGERDAGLRGLGEVGHPLLSRIIWAVRIGRVVTGFGDHVQARISQRHTNVAEPAVRITAMRMISQGVVVGAHSLRAPYQTINVIPVLEELASGFSH